MRTESGGEKCEWWSSELPPAHAWPILNPPIARFCPRVSSVARALCESILYDKSGEKNAW